MANTAPSASISRRFVVPPHFWGGLFTWVLCIALLGPFLVYPVVRVLGGALVQDGQFSPGLLLLPLTSETLRGAMLNSLVLGFTVTVLSSLLAFPLAFAAARLEFPGKSLLTGLTLVPLLLPPLVGAVGLRQLLNREGVIEYLLQRLNITKEPVDFLLLQAPIVAVVAALHLYPLIYLNLSAAWANVDSSLEEAAENMGASGWRVFRTVTLPLLFPGYLSGALIVFVFAFTDLGTPLIFNYKEVAATKIFDARQDVNDPLPYALAVWMLALALMVFWVSRRFLEGGKIATLARGTRRSREVPVGGWKLLLVYLAFTLVIGLSLLPHIGVILASLAQDWSSRLLPAWTTDNYQDVFRDDLTRQAIKTSLLCAALSMSIDIVAGFALAYSLARGRVWGKAFLDSLAMLPLALPGLILAFGLLISFKGTALDPFEYSVPLLVISYAVRRLPYALRAVSSGLQQMSVTLEEASLNLGASPLQTMWRVTRPLVMANLMAAGLLTFAFAVLEVSDSLILSLDGNTYPIAAAVYRIAIEEPFEACALGVLGMLLLTVTFLVANRALGKQLGALFRT
jgi:iron(III) transport system permease protein